MKKHILLKKEQEELEDDEDTSVIVDGPFDQATALALQNNAKYNYFKMRK